MKKKLRLKLEEKRRRIKDTPKNAWLEFLFRTDCKHCESAEDGEPCKLRGAILNSKGEDPITCTKQDYEARITEHAL